MAHKIHVLVMRQNKVVDLIGEYVSSTSNELQAFACAVLQSIFMGCDPLCATNRFVVANCLVDSADSMRFREFVLGELYGIMSKKFHVKLRMYTFGSYRLGVNSPGADIDILFVGPAELHVPDFIRRATKTLSKSEKVTELVSVDGATVPIIKFRYDGVDIDLAYAFVRYDVLPDDLNILSDRILRGCDDAVCRTLNGSRVTDTLFHMVRHVEAFQTAARFIKFWAKQRGVYSNVMGFLGGISWQIMLVKVCLIFPDEDNADTLVRQFFHMFGHVWKWPTPVFLTKHLPDDMVLQLKDHRHMMPIITPCTPCMNSSFNVYESTRCIIQDELKRGYFILQAAKDVGSSVFTSYGEVCKKMIFSTNNKLYIQVVAEASTAEDQLVWKGFVQSKFRRFVVMLERRYIRVKYIPCATSTFVSDICEKFRIGVILYEHTIDDIHVSEKFSIFQEQLNKFKDIVPGMRVNMEFRMRTKRKR